MNGNDPNEFPVFETVAQRLRLTGADAEGAAYTPPPSPETPPLTEADHSLPSAMQFAGGPYSFNGSVPLYGQMASASYPDPLIPPEESTVVPLGAFRRTYTDGDGNLMLQGGAVTGGAKTHVLADKLLLASGDTAPSNGKLVVIHIGLTAITDDGVVLPGCVLDNTAPTIAVSLSTMPDDAIPDDADPGGDMYILLGYWYGGDFIPSGPGGNITVIHWLGSLTASRSS